MIRGYTILFRKSFICLTLFCLVTKGMSQSDDFVLQAENNGRSAVLPKVLYADPFGFLWYSTHNGVVFESGTKREVYEYNHPSGVEVNFTNNLLRTKDDRLFACTDLGLWHLKIIEGVSDWMITTETIYEGKTNMYSVVEGLKSDVWAGDMNGGIYHINGDESNSKIFEGDFGRVELSHFQEGKGLVFKASGTWYLLKGQELNKLFEPKDANSIISRNGNFFPHSTSGYYVYDGKNYQYVYDKELDVQFVSLPFEEIISSYGRGHQQMYEQDILVKENKELLKFAFVETEIGSYDMVLEEVKTYSNKILDAIIYSKGRALVLTQNGIYFNQYAKRPFETFLDKPWEHGLDSAINCRGLTEDSKGNIYIFTYSGFFVLPKGAHKFRPMDLSVPSDFDLDESEIFSIELLDDNTLMAYGANNCFYLIDLENYTLRRQMLLSAEGPKDLVFTDVEKINDSIIWAVSFSGIKEINYKTWTSKDLSYPLKPFTKLPKESGYVLLSSKDGHKIWLGMLMQGLYEWDRKTNKFVWFSKHHPNNTLVGDEVRALHEDRKGNLWVGTSEGLQRITYPDRKSTMYTEENGLYNAHITGILESETAIWAGTYYGLAQVNLKADLIEDYFESDGLTHNEFNVKSAFKSIDNQMYFGGLNGLVRFDPSQFVNFSPPPGLYLLGYNQFDVETGGNKYFSSFTNKKMQFDLPVTKNYITLVFSLSDLFNSHLNTFQYRIPSLNNDWIDLGPSGRVELLGLSPDTYEVQVRGFNSHGKASEILTYFIKVNQILFKRSWFVIFSMLVLVSLFLVFQYKRLLLANSRAQLENKVMRLESRALAAQMNPHFIFNTLNHIQSAVILKGEQEANKLFGSFSDLLRITLENNKKDHIILAHEIDYLKSYLYLEQARLDETINVIWEIDSTLNLKELKIPPMLLQPIVENAIQHGLIPKKGEKELLIKMTQSKSILTVVIQDNGVGREFSEKQVKSHKYKSWATTIMTERISLSNLNAKTSIELSIVDLYNHGQSAGTKVTIKIPIQTKPITNETN